MKTFNERFDEKFYKPERKEWEYTTLAIKSFFQSEFEAIKTEIEKLIPVRREINYHQSYNEGQIDLWDKALDIINSRLGK